MRERYDLRNDPEGWTVFDIWTGQAVVIARSSQTSLSLRDARELKGMLNDQVRRGNRVVLQ